MVPPPNLEMDDVSQKAEDTAFFSFLNAAIVSYVYS